MNQNYSSKNGIRICNNYFSISQEENKLFKFVKGFSHFTTILFSILLLLGSLQSKGQDFDFEIKMKPNSLGTYNLDLTFDRLDSCIVCNRICWKWNGTSCVPEAANSTNRLPFSLSANDWVPPAPTPPCNPHEFFIEDTCKDIHINVFITVDSNRTKTFEMRGACDSFTWIKNGVTYTNSGTYTDTSVSVSGDTTESEIILTINHGTTNSTSATSCGSYTWAVNGMTYFTSGTYTSTSINASGCTDTSILILTINQSTSDTTNAAFCTSYFWTENGVTYTSSGTYTFTELNIAGCTDTYTLILTEICSSVPTISEWGLFILTLVFAALGMIFIYQRKEFPKPSVNKKA